MADSATLAEPATSAPAATAPPAVPPPRKPELVIRPFGNAGQFVVKDPTTGGYYNVGEVEAFLLEQLDGERTADAICAAFEARFGESFTRNDLDDFLDVARSQNFLKPEPSPEVVAAAPRKKRSLVKQLQSLLYWRKSLIDPDPILNWLEPRLRFLWTRTFFALSLPAIVSAFVLSLINSQEMVDHLTITSGTLILAWVVVCAATTLHEFAHGLTCKHHGGEVHEMGFLLMFFMPCFYCDVSDAWLMKEKSKRLWVTLAGTYCDLCLWALGVFAWRLTLPGTLPNSLAIVVVTVCGARCFFNFMPLMKLDGYYFLSDLVEIPNLRQRSFDYWLGSLRWALWGAPRPERDPRGTFLFWFGAVSWAFSLFFLTTMLLAFTQILGSRYGLPGLAWVGFLAWYTIPGLLAGLNQGEIMKMLLTRHWRTAAWAVVLGGMALVLTFVHMEDRASGTFKVLAEHRAELRAQVPGYLRVVYHGDGEKVAAGTVIAELEVPDLQSRLSQKRAEIAEAKAKLTLLEAGPRPEELRESRDKVVRMSQWAALAGEDLKRKRSAMEDEVRRLDEAVNQCQVELDNTRVTLEQSKRLYERKAIALDQLRDYEKRHQIAQAQLNQAKSQKRERVTLGSQESEAELARREKDLKDAESALRLLEAGTRPEEIDAQKAHLDRLEAEFNFLNGLQDRLRIVTPVAGVVTTPHLREKIGSHLKEGDLFCEVEDLDHLRVEIPMLEQELSRIEPGQVVELKPRALPWHSYYGKVDRVAPAAAKGEKEKYEAQASITLYCRLDDAPEGLCPGMTGNARINRGQRAVGAILIDRTVRYLRTEFWW